MASQLPFTAPNMASPELAAHRSAEVTPVLKREERGRAWIVIAVLGVAALAAASLVDVVGPAWAMTWR